MTKLNVDAGIPCLPSSELDDAVCETAVMLFFLDEVLPNGWARFPPRTFAINVDGPFWILGFNGDENADTNGDTATIFQRRNMTLKDFMFVMMLVVTLICSLGY